MNNIEKKCSVTARSQEVGGVYTPVARKARKVVLPSHPNQQNISKELEVVNFQVLRENQLANKAKDGNVKHWILDDKRPEGKDKNKIDQFSSFQKAMKVLLVWGLCMGLNPVTGIFQKDVSKMRFTVCSWKFLHAITMAICQSIGMCLCFYKLFNFSIGIRTLGFLIFFSTTCCTTFSFIRIATKWPNLLKELSNSRLDEYVDSNIKRKCNIACIAFIGMAIMEHVLSILSRIAKIMDCSVNITDYVEEFAKQTSPWLYEFNVTYTPALATVLQVINVTSTATWNYSDLFIVCMSLYLTSILNQINKRIALAADKNYMPGTIWAVLREDYTRATRLVRLFDETISSVILVSFASDLFFICSQLFNVLANRVKSNHIRFAKECPNYPSGPLQGYEYPIYVIYSSIFLYARFLTVSLIAASVNTASLKPASVLYSIPSSAYTKEVERFLNQVNGEVVALSGLQFFYITREMVLSIAGTIVTYELVLLQFNSDQLSKN